jgi:hypothetical protein
MQHHCDGLTLCIPQLSDAPAVERSHRIASKSPAGIGLWATIMRASEA